MLRQASVECSKGVAWQPAPARPSLDDGSMLADTDSLPDLSEVQLPATLPRETVAFVAYRNKIISDLINYLLYTECPGEGSLLTVDLTGYEEMPAEWLDGARVPFVESLAANLDNPNHAPALLPQTTHAPVHLRFGSFHFACTVTFASREKAEAVFPEDVDLCPDAYELLGRQFGYTCTSFDDAYGSIRRILDFVTAPPLANLVESICVHMPIYTEVDLLMVPEDRISHVARCAAVVYVVPPVMSEMDNICRLQKFFANGAGLVLQRCDDFPASWSDLRSCQHDFVAADLHTILAKHKVPPANIYTLEPALLAACLAQGLAVDTSDVEAFFRHVCAVAGRIKPIFFYSLLV